MDTWKTAREQCLSTLLPACASEQGKVIGLVSVYIYNVCTIFFFVI